MSVLEFSQAAAHHITLHHIRLHYILPNHDSVCSLADANVKLVRIQHSHHIATHRKACHRFTCTDLKVMLLVCRPLQ